MPKKIKNNMPDFQERVLMAMYAALIDPSGNHENWLYFQQGRGIAHSLGGVWSTYRHQQMLKLQDSGGIVCKKRVDTKATWFYALTEKGIQRTREILAVARQSAFSERIEHFQDPAQADTFPAPATRYWLIDDDTTYHEGVPGTVGNIGVSGEQFDDLPF